MILKENKLIHLASHIYIDGKPIVQQFGAKVRYTTHTVTCLEQGLTGRIANTAVPYSQLT